MDRRKFIKNALLWSAGAGVQVPLFDISEVLAAENIPLKDPNPKVFVAEGRPYDKMVRKLIAEFGGLKDIIKPGAKVVIKPNIGWDRTPDLAANTHPIVVRTLVELALDHGASEIRVFDRTCNEKRRCYKNSGMSDVLKGVGGRRVKLMHMDKRKYIPVDIRKGKALKRWEIYSDVLDADAFINVPVAKHHGISRLTLGLKNSMGVIGGNRGKLHFELGQNLADLATVLRPDLTVIDATRILLRNGPQGGSRRDVQELHKVIATTDPVAADAYATTLFDMMPEDIDSTVAAYEMGLGQMDLEKMKVQEIKV